MQTIYQINADEIDQSLLESIKAQFKNKEIEIVVSERDETEYLLRSPANRERLLRAIGDVEANRNIIVPEQEQFQGESSLFIRKRSSNSANGREPTKNFSSVCAG